MEEILQLDRDLFLYLNGLGTSTWDTFWQFVSHKLSSLPLYVFLLVLCLWKLGKRQTLWVLVAVVVLIAASDQLSNLFKYGLERLRPCHDPELTDMLRLVKGRCGGKFGYFSAHASNSFALAVFFGLLLKRYFKGLLPFLVLWAMAVSYSRIYLGVHFPLDVLTGAVVGCILGGLCVKLYIFVRRNYFL